MTSPDADPRPDSSASSPEALASGQRTLAAIVFTDTVGFSALMSKNEEQTLRLVARDLDQMKTTCQAFGGQVLKSTGDGLLMLFTSAVQAVACALEIQRDMAKRNPDLPPVERLQHRIGIHLGDVFQSGGDVMGDGVNIAARLQTQAIPGGICLSNTVYEVVNNRLPFYVNDLGARKLKNIGMVTAYQISPADGTQGGRRFGMAWYRWRPWFWGGVGVAALLFALGIVYKLGVSRRQQERHPMHAFPALSAIIPARAEPASPLSTMQASSNSSTVRPRITDVSETEFEMARFEYMRKFDFEGMLNWMQTHDWPEKNLEILSEKCTKFDHLFDWCQEQLHRYSAANPLVVVSKRNKTFLFWPTNFGSLRMKSDAQLLTLTRDQIPPLIMVGMIDELIKRNGSPNRAENLQLTEELALFIEYYHVKVPGQEAAPAVKNP